MLHWTTKVNWSLNETEGIFQLSFLAQKPGVLVNTAAASFIETTTSLPSLKLTAEYTPETLGLVQMIPSFWFCLSYFQRLFYVSFRGPVLNHVFSVMITSISGHGGVPKILIIHFFIRSIDHWYSRIPIDLL